MNKTLSAILIMVLCVVSATVTAQKTAAYTIGIDSLLNALESNNKAMVSVTIRQDDQIRYSRATGFTDNYTNSPLPSTSETRYRIGSISKMFTSVMILQLVEEQKLSLDTPLSKFFPKVPNAESITIADMLNHHSGLFSFTNSEDYPKWMTEPMTRKQMLDVIQAHQSAFAPHQKGEYSNTNFVLLGYIIEDLTGKSYKENLTERITSRIGLKNTLYGGKINHSANEASSFGYAEGKWVMLPETDMSIPGGAGSVISTANDLTVFISALFNGKLISESTLKTMTTITDGYGLGIFQFPFYERYAFGHTGDIDGFSTSLAYFPEDKVSIALCSNGLNYSKNDIMIGLLSYYFGRPYIIPTFKTQILTTEKLSAYEGEYSSEQLPMKITVKKEGDKLTAQATGQSAFPLEAASETEFRFDKAGIVMTFQISASGHVDGFILKQGANYVFKKVLKP